MFWIGRSGAPLTGCPEGPGPQHVAHQAGVVHRDLKPANVMVNDRLEPVVMDFGLARRSAGADPRVTTPGDFVGTPAYSPPERVGGGPDDAGPAGDIYSLGVMLYEMLTGRLPFVGAAHEVLRQVLTSEPEPPSRHVPGLDRRLEAICCQAMAREPGERYASMQALAAALDAYLGTDGLFPPATSELSRGAAAPADTTSPTGAGPAPENSGQNERGLTTPSRPRSFRAVWISCLVLGAVLLAIILPLTIRPEDGGTERHSNDPADALQAGSHWSGWYHFLPKDKNPRGDVAIDIQERKGETFRGVYTTDKGRYRWRIEGTLRGTKVRWQFTKIIKEASPVHVVGKAEVTGELVDKELRVEFRHSYDNSHAEMRLWLRK